MSYLVLARKYRPQTFDQVVNQTHVTQTLINAISMGRVAHAILFTGPRGTGKTTIARILAKAMNCATGPTPTPCNSCRSCREITIGSGNDVYEIDGASNNSVDQVRELRENIKYMPVHSPYKIYIIDEVHMLSTAAFNALLKTLEEPPAHVMFILATTEPHKLPATILSRCQRHDFKRLDTQSVSTHLTMLCEKENITISEDSINLIAREASGSMRDAESLLDQVMVCSEGKIEYAHVLEILGVVDRKLIYEISEAIFNRDITTLLDRLDDIYDRGHDMKRLYAHLLGHFRNMLIVKMGKHIDKLVDLPGNEIDWMHRQVKEVSLGTLNQMMDLFFKEEPTIRYSTQPKLILEMILIRLFQMPPTLSIDELIVKLDRFRQNIKPADPGSVVGPVDHLSGIHALSDPMAEEKSSESIPRPEIKHKEDTSPFATSPLGEKKPEEIWQQITRTVAETHPSLAANLSRCYLKNITDTLITIQVNSNGYTLNTLRRNKNLAILKKVYRDLFGISIDILIETDMVENKGKINGGSHEHQKKNEALRHPRISDAIEIFNGKVIDVKLL